MQLWYNLDLHILPEKKAYYRNLLSFFFNIFQCTVKCDDHQTFLYSLLAVSAEPSPNREDTYNADWQGIRHLWRADKTPVINDGGYAVCLFLLW